MSGLHDRSQVEGYRSTGQEQRRASVPLDGMCEAQSMCWFLILYMMRGRDCGATVAHLILSPAISLYLLVLGGGCGKKQKKPREGSVFGSGCYVIVKMLLLFCRK